MAEPTRRRQSRQRRPNPRPTAAPVNAKGSAALRERLRSDRFLFVLCLAGLGFVTWACAMTWWVTGATAPLAVALASVVPAFYLFYLRDT
jgi:hypothetical protein